MNCTCEAPIGTETTADETLTPEEKKKKGIRALIRHLLAILRLIIRVIRGKRQADSEAETV